MCQFLGHPVFSSIVSLYLFIQYTLYNVRRSWWVLNFCSHWRLGLLDLKLSSHSAVFAAHNSKLYRSHIINRDKIRLRPYFCILPCMYVRVVYAVSIGRITDTASADACRLVWWRVSQHQQLPAKLPRSSVQTVQPEAAKELPAAGHDRQKCLLLRPCQLLTCT